jgi:hypothetical protein
MCRRKKFVKFANARRVRRVKPLLVPRLHPLTLLLYHP